MITPISFELAKLLKEKGFEERTKSYNQEGKLVTVSMTIRRLNLDKIYYPAPTIAEVVIWLYEKHGIWIECLHRGDMGDFTFKISKLKKGWRTKPHYIHENGYNSPTEVYELAIEYCLTNLI